MKNRETANFEEQTDNGNIYPIIYTGNWLVVSAELSSYRQTIPQPILTAAVRKCHIFFQLIL